MGRKKCLHIVSKWFFTFNGFNPSVILLADFGGKWLNLLTKAECKWDYKVADESGEYKTLVWTFFARKIFFCERHKRWIDGSIENAFQKKVIKTFAAFCRPEMIFYDFSEINFWGTKSKAIESGGSLEIFPARNRLIVSNFNI